MLHVRAHPEYIGHATATIQRRRSDAARRSSGEEGETAGELRHIEISMLPCNATSAMGALPSAAKSVHIVGMVPCNQWSSHRSFILLGATATPGRGGRACCEGNACVQGSRSSKMWIVLPKAHSSVNCGFERRSVEDDRKNRRLRCLRQRADEPMGGQSASWPRVVEVHDSSTAMRRAGLLLRLAAECGAAGQSCGGL